MTTARPLIGGLVAGAVLAALALGGRLDTLEHAALDRLFALRGPRPPATPIVIVAIDEASFDTLNLPWPFPRALHARLVDVIRAGRPAAIGFDVVFAEPSARGAGDDRSLGEAIARAGNVVLAAAPEVYPEAFSRKVDLNLPVGPIRRAAAGVGAVNLFADEDGAVRQAPLRLRVEDETLPAFDVELRRVALTAGIAAATLPRSDPLRINYRGGPQTFPRISYHRVVRGEVPPETFAGAIVLIGSTSPVMQDVYSTPFALARSMPGVEIHANILETLLLGIPLRAAPVVLSAAVALLAGAVAGGLVGRLRALRALGAVTALAVLLAGGTYLAFVHTDLWFPAAGPGLALVLGYGVALVDSFVREQRERRRLGQFFSPAVLREIVRQRSDVSLGSRRRVLTVLFTDIRGFTAISERLEPEQVVELLREYFSEMTEIVFRHGGTVDKYVGDCLMALYNVPFEDPDHAATAVRCALEFQERTAAVAARWEARLGVGLRCGVGIHTGEAVVGTMGSRQRLEYTAVGDTVNLAAHLETLTKDYGAPIVISEATRERVRDRFVTRSLGEATVKGRTAPVRIYAVEGIAPGNRCRIAGEEAG